jgi:predicted DNA-binding protein (MmcQ/YjbR family)
MTADEFRQMALSFPGAEEGSHMNHPDFRVKGKIFATLGPDLTWGMVKLTPEDQQAYLLSEPSAFKPASGAWGQGGATLITLAEADETSVHEAIEAAWSRLADRDTPNILK